MKQLEEMSEKGNFNNEYRVVVSSWYMMMLPTTKVGTPLLAPQAAQRAAWEWEERDIEYRRQKGAEWRSARESSLVFDAERALKEPYSFEQMQPAAHKARAPPLLVLRRAVFGRPSRTPRAARCASARWRRCSRAPACW